MTDHDPVSNPSHYVSHPSGVECIEITEHMNFNLGNATKYIWRAGGKADAIEDLQKAAWYVNREIERLQRKPEPVAPPASPEEIAQMDEYVRETEHEAVANPERTQVEERKVKSGDRVRRTLVPPTFVRGLALIVYDNGKVFVQWADDSQSVVDSCDLEVIGKEED